MATRKEEGNLCALQGAAFNTLHAALVAAQASMATAAATTAADAGADGPTTKTQVAAAAVLIAALSDAALGQLMVCP